MSYTFIRKDKHPIIVSCEHAAKRIPRTYGTFLLPRKKLVKVSEYYDIGAQHLARILANNLQASLILAKYSRLVIDLNRSTNDETLIIANSRGTPVPGNKNLSLKEKAHRIKNYYTPYHERLNAEIEKLQKKHAKAFFITVHSFNNVLNGVERKVDIGLLYKHDKDEPFSKQLKKQLDKHSNHTVKFNEPYSAKNPASFIVGIQGKNSNVKCVEFEINDKHLKSPTNIKKMGALLTKVTREAILNFDY